MVFFIKSSLWSKISNSSYIEYFALITIVNSFVNVDTDRYFQNQYQSGKIALILSKPINLGIHTFIQDLGNSLAKIVLHTVPLLIFFYFIYGLKFNSNSTTLILFIISLLFSFLFSWVINFIVGISVFYLKNNEGLIQFKYLILSFFTGSLIPYQFFPDALNKVLDYLPFRVIYQIPFQLLESGVSSSFRLLSIQLFWCTIFYFFASWFAKRSIDRVEIMGG